MEETSYNQHQPNKKYNIQRSQNHAYYSRNINAQRIIDQKTIPEIVNTDVSRIMVHAIIMFSRKYVNIQLVGMMLLSLKGALIRQ